MKDLTKTMEIMREAEEEDEAEAESLETDGHKGEIHDTDTKVAAESSAAGESSEKKTTFVATETGTTTSHSAPSSLAPEKEASIPPRSAASTPRPGAIPTRHLLTERSDEDQQLLDGMTEKEKDLRQKEKKKGGLSKEQREELAAYEAERKKVRQERVDNLTRKLIDRISVWTETDKGTETTHAFNEKTKYEVENLKMESFGIDILHCEYSSDAFLGSGMLTHHSIAIGSIYISKGAAFIKSQKFLGIGGFFSRLKDKGTLFKDTWGTISTAIDAQMTMEEMAKLEEKGGDEWTDEKKAEYERKVTGKILAAAWRGSKFEIQSVLRLLPPLSSLITLISNTLFRDVCDKVLYDKPVPLAKRVERAHALIMVGTIFKNVCGSNVTTNT